MCVICVYNLVYGCLYVLNGNIVLSVIGRPKGSNFNITIFDCFYAGNYAIHSFGLFVCLFGLFIYLLTYTQSALHISAIVNSFAAFENTDVK